MPCERSSDCGISATSSTLSSDSEGGAPSARASAPASTASSAISTACTGTARSGVSIPAPTAPSSKGQPGARCVTRVMSSCTGSSSPGGAQ